MTGPPVRRVGVVGCGLMGAGIAEACALAGLDVRVVVSSRDALDRGRRRVDASLDRALRRGRIGEAQRDEAAASLSFTADLADLGDRQLVVESITEDEQAKTGLFAALDKAVEDPEAILASNTSATPIMRLARATHRPGHVVGLHFFSPVQANRLVELTGSLLTEDEAAARAEAFAAEILGKQVIRSADRTGFVVNTLLIPYLVAAVRMVESGFATAETVDRGMVLGCAHPMGPLKLADMIGLDVVASVAGALYAEFKEPLYASPPLLTRMVEGGLLGRKTGRGFYTYTG